MVRVHLSLSLSFPALSESVKACGAEALVLLGEMKQQDSLAAADSSKLKAALEAILATAEVRALHWQNECLCSDTVKIKWVEAPPETK